jgi:glucarate dehydratase
MPITNTRPPALESPIPSPRPLEVAITGIRAIPIAIPLSYVYKWGPGAYAGFTRTLVEVETSVGVTGIGESGNARDARIIEESLAPRLLGADPFNLADCERRAIPSYTGLLTARDLTRLNAYSGIEMALWDVAGKLTGHSIAQLLGGRVRDEVSFSEYFALPDGGSSRDITSVADACAQAIADHGATVFEGKVGVLPLHEEARLIRRVRDAVGETIPIRLDANMSWDVSTARQALPVFADLGVTWIEEPVASQAELIRLRMSSPISFSSHQIDLPQAARDGVPDAFVVKIHYLGGIRRTVDFITACSMFGIPVWFRAPSAGVATAAELQIAAALAPMSHPSQNLSRWLSDDVTDRGPFHAANGVVAVPDGPGLGVALDPEGVARCADRARDAPLHDPFTS